MWFCSNTQESKNQIRGEAATTISAPLKGELSALRAD